jgi:hypothetical protein
MAPDSQRIRCEDAAEHRRAAQRGIIASTVLRCQGLGARLGRRSRWFRGHSADGTTTLESSGRQPTDGAAASRHEARIHDGAPKGIDAAEVPAAEFPMWPHVHGQPWSAPGEREVQECRDGSVLDPVELLLGLRIHEREPGAASIESKDATESPAQREQRSRRHTLTLPAEGIRPLGQRGSGRQRRVHFPDVVQRECLGAREGMNPPGAPEMVRRVERTWTAHPLEASLRQHHHLTAPHPLRAHDQVDPAA